MKYTFSLLVSIAFFAIHLSGQKPSLKTKFGKISSEEMNMASYPEDPNAPAVVLFDKGLISHPYKQSTGFAQEFERHIRIKIFKKEAFSLANFAIFHWSDQKFAELKASCYNLQNGELVETELDTKNTFDENLTRTRMLKKINIPAVKEGSIIELKYRLINNESIGLDGWVFQREEIPTIWSELEAEVPAFIEFQKTSQGWVKFELAEESQIEKSINLNYSERQTDRSVTKTVFETVKIEYPETSLHFIQQNIPALKPESFLPSTRDILSQINFDVRAIYNTDVISTGTTYRIVNTIPRKYKNTWENLGKEVLEEVYDNLLKSSKFTEKESNTCIEGKETNSEKIAAIYEFVGKNFQINNLSYIWTTQTLESLMKNRKGSCSDINLLFINLLRRANINAYPMLISTCDNGLLLPFRVSLNGFNRVIAVVEPEPNTKILMDVSNWPSPIGLLPAEDLNFDGLVLYEKDSIQWQPIQNKINTRSAMIADLTIKESGSMSGEISFFETGYGAVNARAALKTADTPTFIQEKFKPLIETGNAKNYQIENAENWQEPILKGKFEVETATALLVSGDKIYLNPSLTLGITETPFKEPSRKFNINLGYPNESTYVFKFTIPQGYKVEEVPKSAKSTFGDQAIFFDYLLEVKEQQINVNFKIRYKKTYITADMYEELRTFYSNMISKLAEQIILTKI